MNVDNPHPLLLLLRCPNTTAPSWYRAIEGGWTLVSWDEGTGPASRPRYSSTCAS